jgi:hypothetical protein
MAVLLLLMTCIHADMHSCFEQCKGLCGSHAQPPQRIQASIWQHDNGTMCAGSTSAVWHFRCLTHQLHRAVVHTKYADGKQASKQASKQANMQTASKQASKKIHSTPQAKLRIPAKLAPDGSWNLEWKHEPGPHHVPMQCKLHQPMHMQPPTRLLLKAMQGEQARQQTQM